MTLRLIVHGGTSFRALDPTLDAGYEDQYYFRHDWAPNVLVDAWGIGRTVPRWEAAVVGRGTSAGLGRVERARPERFLVYKPAEPACVNVTCRVGAEFRTVSIWFVDCRLAVLNRGAPGRDDPGWPQVQRFLREHYVGNQAYDFPELGVIRFRFSTYGGLLGTRYAGMVQMVGTVRPPEVPISFYHARRIVSASISAVDARGAPLPPARGTHTTVPAAGSNDTSGRTDGANTPLVGVGLSDAGKLFDYDLPGAFMNSQNTTGDTHRWQVQFEQVVGIGRVPRASAWDATMNDPALGRPRNVSDVVRWQVDLTARCTSPVGTVLPEVEVTGSAG